MKDKLFYRLLIGLFLAGTLATAGLMAYTADLYGKVSIISFIANESPRKAAPSVPLEHNTEEKP